MRIKLLGRRRQWFLEKGEDCLSERSERVPQPQKPSASAAVKKAPMRRALWFFLSAQKERKSTVTLYDKNYLYKSKINRTAIIALLTYPHSLHFTLCAHIAQNGHEKYES